jgi:hypothetical protein
MSDRSEQSGFSELTRLNFGNRIDKQKGTTPMKNSQQNESSELHEPEQSVTVEDATDIRVRTKERPKDLTKGQRDHVVLLWNDNEHTGLFVMGYSWKFAK